MVSKDAIFTGNVATSPFISTKAQNFSISGIEFEGLTCYQSYPVLLDLNYPQNTNSGPNYKVSDISFRNAPNFKFLQAQAIAAFSAGLLQISNVQISGVTSSMLINTLSVGTEFTNITVSNSVSTVSNAILIQQFMGERPSKFLARYNVNTIEKGQATLRNITVMNSSCLSTYPFLSVSAPVVTVDTFYAS